MHFLSLTNATADFEHEVEVADTDPWGDPITRKQWEVNHSSVEVRFDPQGSSTVAQASGDLVSRPARLYAPLWVSDAHDTGDRVTIYYRGTERMYRMATLQALTFDGRDGYVAADLQDYADTER